MDQESIDWLESIGARRDANGPQWTLGTVCWEYRPDADEYSRWSCSAVWPTKVTGPSAKEAARCLRSGHERYTKRHTDALAQLAKVGL